MVLVKNVTVIPEQYKQTSDLNTISKLFDITYDKVFIPSLTELNNNSYNFSLNNVNENDEFLTFPSEVNLMSSDIQIKEGKKFNSFILRKQIDSSLTSDGVVLSSDIKNVTFSGSLSSLISSEFKFECDYTTISTFINSNLGIQLNNKTITSKTPNLFEKNKFPLSSKISVTKNNGQGFISIPISSSLSTKNKATLNFENMVSHAYEFNLIKTLSGTISSNISDEFYNYASSFNNNELTGFFNTGRQNVNGIISTSNAKLYSNEKYYTLLHLNKNIDTTSVNNGISFGQKSLEIDLIPNAKSYQNVFKHIVYVSGNKNTYYYTSTNLKIFDSNGNLILPFMGSIKFILNENRTSIKFKTNIVIDNSKQISINLQDTNKTVPSSMFDSLSYDETNDQIISSLISGSVKDLKLNGECHLTKDNILEINLNGDMNNINTNTKNLSDYLLNDLYIDINASLNEMNLQHLKIMKKISSSDIINHKISYGKYWTRSIDKSIDSRIKYINNLGEISESFTESFEIGVLPIIVLKK